METQEAFQSKFKGKFQQLRDLGLFKLRGPLLIVEVMPQIELKTESGIILGVSKGHKATAQDFRAQLGVVVYRGEGYTDGTEMDIKEGFVVNMPSNPKYMSEFPGLAEYTQNALAIISEDDVLYFYRSLEDFNSVFAALAKKG